MTPFRLPLALLVLMPSLVLAQATDPAPKGMTLQQFQAAGRGRLLDRDADGDGKISAAEFAAGAGGKRGGGAGGDPARAFARLDANHDGYLDKAEIDAMLATRFARMDANHDGVVTAEERAAARGAMRGRAAPEE